MIQIGTLVENTEGKRGVVAPENPPYVTTDFPGNVLVGWEGSTSLREEEVADLTVIGPENAAADLEKCGAGTSRACIFLAAGEDGITCQRFNRLRMPLIMATMKATRHPKAMFPACQDEPFES